MRPAENDTSEGAAAAGPKMGNNMSQSHIRMTAQPLSVMLYNPASVPALTPLELPLSLEGWQN